MRITIKTRRFLKHSKKFRKFTRKTEIKRRKNPKFTRKSRTKHRKRLNNRIPKKNYEKITRLTLKLYIRNPSKPNKPNTKFVSK